MPIEYKGRALGVSYSVGETVADVRKKIAAAIKKSVHRIELRGKPASEKDKNVAKYQNDAKKLSDYGITADTVLVVKDLGPQFSYRGVFLIEYLGPILIIAAFTLRPAFLFGDQGQLKFWDHLTAKAAESQPGTGEWNSFVQALAIALWIAHFAKRELETLFVHKFSRATMPLSNLFKNSIYYWGFAMAVGFPLVHSAYTAPASRNQVLAAVGLWAASQLTNLAVHVQLSFMRPAEGSQERKPPTGPLFALVSCPNYTAEVLGWVAWSLLTQITFSYVFTLVGLAQMTQWALAKHRGYLKDTSFEYKKLGRKAIIPFVI